MSVDTIDLEISHDTTICGEKTTIYGQDVVCELMSGHRGYYHKSEILYSRNDIELIISVRWKTLLIK